MANRKFSSSCNRYLKPHIKDTKISRPYLNKTWWLPLRAAFVFVDLAAAGEWGHRYRYSSSSKLIVQCPKWWVVHAFRVSCADSTEGYLYSQWQEGSGEITDNCFVLLSFLVTLDKLQCTRHKNKCICFVLLSFFSNFTLYKREITRS